MPPGRQRFQRAALSPALLIATAMGLDFTAIIPTTTGSLWHYYRPYPYSQPGAVHLRALRFGAALLVAINSSFRRRTARWNNCDLAEGAVMKSLDSATALAAARSLACRHRHRYSGAAAPQAQKAASPANRRRPIYRDRHARYHRTRDVIGRIPALPLEFLITIGNIPDSVGAVHLGLHVLDSHGVSKNPRLASCVHLCGRASWRVHIAVSNFTTGATAMNATKRSRFAARTSSPISGRIIMTISGPGRGLVRRLGVAAAAIFALAAASQARRGAVAGQSRCGAGGETRSRRTDDGGPTRRRWWRPWRRRFSRRWWRRLSRRWRLPWRWFRGGGVAFHGGGFRGGGVCRLSTAAAIVPARASMAVASLADYRYAYHRPYFYHRHHHFHRRFYAPRLLRYPRYYAIRTATAG